MLRPSRSFALLTAALTLTALLTGSLLASGSGSGEAGEKPLYEQLLALLRDEKPLVPELEGVHPIHTVFNREAVVPPQCYTRTEGTHNPCYVCHQDYLEGRENTMNDGELQLAYSFSDVGTRNHWKNLFTDRTEAVAAISDAAILRWIRTDNYSGLADRLEAMEFEGWIPDLDNLHRAADAFDEEGFALDGSDWVAFSYKPLPSTFWPTNGSTDDVMIRLPENFRTFEGRPSRDAYKANLAILEAAIKGFDRIETHGIDESKIDTDLDGDGHLGTARRIATVKGFVADAAEEPFETHLYPEGTEFLHTVRYVDRDENGTIGPSARMKEVRYMRKWQAYGKMAYKRQYQLERFEKEAGHLPGYQYIGHHGLDNGNGWSIQGFIEDRDGELRASTLEENLFCMGCHNTVGATIDKTFSFARKVDGAEGWQYIDLQSMPDAPNRGEEKGEYLTYFERVGGGDEFRSNREMIERWLLSDGTVNTEKVTAAKDVYELITPSWERALLLNKAYRVLVDEQSFIYGRDATVTPPFNVYEQVDMRTAPTLPPEKTYIWDIRLDWQAPVKAAPGRTGSP